MTAARLFSLGIYISLGFASLGCEADPPIVQDAGAPSDSKTSAEYRIGQNIRTWFELYENPQPIPPNLDQFLGRDNVTFRSRDETIRGREDLLAWARRTSEQFSRVEIEVGAIDILREDPRSFIARFHVDRRGWDDEDLLHIASAHHTWHVELDAADALVLVEAEESITLPHPGTGTKVLCL